MSINKNGSIKNETLEALEFVLDSYMNVKFVYEQWKQKNILKTGIEYKNNICIVPRKES